MTKIHQKLINLKNKGKKITAKNKKTGKKETFGSIDDEVHLMVDENRYVIQKIKRSNKNEYVYRFGYYTYDANETRLYWGQSAAILRYKDLKELLDEAHKRWWNHEK